MMQESPELNPATEQEGPHGRWKRPAALPNHDFIEDTPSITTMGFRGGDQGALRARVRLLVWQWAAATIDGLVGVTLSCAFLLVTVLLQSDVNMAAVLRGFGTLPLALFVLSITLLSQTFLRIFLLQTVGEWACGHRLVIVNGKHLWALRVLLRQVLVVLGGLVLFSLFLMATGRDIIGSITGLVAMDSRSDEL